MTRLRYVMRSKPKSHVVLQNCAVSSTRTLGQSLLGRRQLLYEGVLRLRHDRHGGLDAVEPRAFCRGGLCWRLVAQQASAAVFAWRDPKR
jgi:hypothetical protein